MAQVAKSNEAEKATDIAVAISGRIAEKAADNLAAISSRTGDNVAAIGRRTADRTVDVTREAIDRTEDTVRRGFEQVQRTTGAALEIERVVARRSAEGATEVGQAFAELVREQARDNVETFRALAGAFDWERAAKVQAGFVRASLERSAAFTRRYLEVVQAVTASAVSATKGQARKAA